ncbi:hypothetical protein [Micromonospora sp. L31]|uniref:hypothetical protein n=1 Tax=Micromonospora TaxID=1873 RepID=UPI003F8B58E2
MADVTPAGSHAVRTTVRRRRKVAVTAGAAVALVLIAGPAAGYAALGRGPAPPAPATSTEPTPGTTQAPSVSPSASATSKAQAAPDGRISRAQLLAATVDLPAWASDAPCADAGARLSDKGVQDGDNWLTTVKYGDVDRDGAQETIAIIRCVYLQTGQSQVVAFDRNDSGNIVTLGRVVATDRIVGAPTAEKIGWISGIDPRADGSVRVKVGDSAPGGGESAETIQWQWRKYEWTGERFEQTGGPTTFPAAKQADLRVTATDVTFGEPTADGTRHGNTTVTIHNAGPADVDYAFLWLNFGDSDVRQERAGWSGCLEVGRNDIKPTKITCLLGKMRAGETKTLVLGLFHPGQLGTVSGTAQVMRLNTERDPVDDAKQTDNVVTFALR